MVSKPRNLILADNSFYHTMWQCHNRDWLLKWDWSKQLYYDLLLKYKDEYEMIFHSYHFMDNHIHLTGEVKNLENFSNFFRLVNNLFARKLNKRLERRGQIIMQRFLSPMIKDDRHMLAVMAYIDLNGVRVGKHKRPEDNRWSSYGYYAYGKPDPLIEPVPSYLGLGLSEKSRQQAYRNVVEGQLLICSV